MLLDRRRRRTVCRVLIVDVLERRGRRESLNAVAVDVLLRCCRSADTVETGMAVSCYLWVCGFVCAFVCMYVCLFVNAVTLEWFEISSKKFYVSKIWPKLEWDRKWLHTDAQARSRGARGPTSPFGQAGIRHCVSLVIWRLGRSSCQIIISVLICTEDNGRRLLPLCPHLYEKQ